MKHVTLHLPDSYIAGLKELVDSKLYPNKSEAIRTAIRDLLKKEFNDSFVLFMKNNIDSKE